MGFKRPDQNYRLEFADGDFSGLEVTLRHISVDTFSAIAENFVHFLNEQDTVEGVAAFGKLVGMFSNCLVSWNIEEEDGTPVPADESGVRSMGIPFFIKILTCWIDGMMGVPAPLGTKSSTGGTSQEESIPMDPL